MSIKMNDNFSNINNYSSIHKKEADEQLNKISSGEDKELDDAAKVLIANALMSDATALSQGVQNANNAVAMAQIVDGSLSQISDNAMKLKELSVAYNNAGLNSSDKRALQQQFDSTMDVITDIKEQTTFNGKNLFGSDMEFSLSDGNVNLEVGSISQSGVDISSMDSVDSFLEEINASVQNVGSFSSSMQSRIDSMYSSLESKNAAYSQLADIDMADAVNKYKSENLLLDASMIAQAHSKNIDQQKVLALLA
jgi:flagellin